MRVDIITLFPELFGEFFRLGVCGRAAADGKMTPHCWNPRDYAAPPHYLVDDRPYGGGSGMTLMAAPLMAAVAAADAAGGGQRIYLTPRGELLSDATARRLATAPGLMILCGRYLGVDERAVAAFGGMEISVGDYVLSGGEVAAMALLEATLRYVPGVLGNSQSPNEDAFADGLLAPPTYTRPENFNGARAPAVLLSGDHEKIQQWRRQQAEEITRQRRPDLLK